MAGASPAPRRRPRTSTRPKPTPLEAMRAEADNYERESIPVPFQTAMGVAEDGIRVTHPLNWAYKVADAYAEGRFGALMRGIIVPEDYPAFDKLEPTIGDVMEFLRDWERISGQDLGKSLAL